MPNVLKKSQMQMTETIAVIVIFFILIVAGLIFYAKFQTDSIEKKQAEVVTKKAIALSLTSSFLPELRCSNNNVIVQDCVDMLKLKSFKYLIDDEDNPEFKTYYSLLFGQSNIYVTDVTGQLEPEVKLYESDINWTRRSYSPIPIVQRTIDDKYYFGVLNVEALS